MRQDCSVMMKYVYGEGEDGKGEAKGKGIKRVQKKNVIVLENEEGGRNIKGEVWWW